jgi:cytochrome c553
MGLLRFVPLLSSKSALLPLKGSNVARQKRYKQIPYWRWKRNSFIAISTFALIASVKSMAVEGGSEVNAQRIGNGNPVVGKEKSDDGRCQECHGAEGLSSDAKIPNHAGQYAGYLVKQLRDFQTGARNHETMSIMAEGLSASDMADIAAYFASQKTMEGEGGRNNPLAEKLFLNGDQSRDIKACVSCHGDNGKGRVVDNVIYPVIGGQRPVYLRSQLVNWKMGDRQNSPDGVMSNVAKSLSDDEIDALANYISGL